MGLFGVRKTPSRDNSFNQHEKGTSLSPRNAAPSNARVKLANLFADSDESNLQVEPPSGKKEDIGVVPTIHMDGIEDKKLIPTDAVTPVAATPVTATQYADDDRTFAALGRKKTVVKPAMPVMSNGLQELAVQRAESMSRLAKRNSIKRSISRKIAKSESRRQFLNIRDNCVSEDRPGAIAGQSASISSSTDGIGNDVSRTTSLVNNSVQNVSRQMGRLSMSPISSAANEVVDGSGIRKSQNDDEPLNFDNSLEDEGALKLADDIDDDLEHKHASLRDIGKFKNETTHGTGEIVATVAGVEGARQASSGNPPKLALSASKVKARKRPPPLLGADDKKSAPDSNTDWPSGGFFGSDGGFMTGGFKITAEGMVGKPPAVTREDSDTQLDGEVPQSERNMIIVRSLKEFQVGPTIGAGAAGRVYMAEHMPSKRTMAMKVVNVYDKQKRNQLLKELETLSKHVSRYLVRFHGAFYDGSGAVHIALEYMDHGCLSTFIQKVGPIPEPVVKMIAMDCLRGLRFLHRHHVLHRDFKTANILLSRRLCCAKLSDFGLARDLNPGVSKVDTFVGTVAYMSPERLQGSKYTYASDIWALGVSIVECLLGRYPFDRPQNYFDYIEATMTANMLSGVDHRGVRFSPEVRDFVSLCTFADPKRRPTAVELLGHPWLSGLQRDNDLFGSWLDECRIVSMHIDAATSKGRRR